MLAAGELVEHGGVGGDDQVARGLIAAGEDLHVPRAAGVADVDRVGQDAGGDPAFVHLGAQAAKPVGAHGLYVDLTRRGLTVEAAGRARSAAALFMPIEEGHSLKVPLIQQKAKRHARPGAPAR